jgi:hypothetical protein
MKALNSQNNIILALLGGGIGIIMICLCFTSGYYGYLFRDGQIPIGVRHLLKVSESSRVQESDRLDFRIKKSNLKIGEVKKIQIHEWSNFGPTTVEVIKMGAGIYQVTDLNKQISTCFIPESSQKLSGVSSEQGLNHVEIDMESSCLDNEIPSK